MPSVAHIIRRRRNRKQRKHESQLRSRLWSSFIVASLSAIVVIPLLVIFGVAGWLYGRAVSAMPSPADTIYLDPIIGPTNFYDRSGTELLYSVQDPLGDERQWIDIETLPAYLIDATLAFEDPDFLQVGGFDFGITWNRLWRYILGTTPRRDSSIAGRLATNALIPSARASGLDDDVLHIVLSAEVQRRYTPRRVLEWYLNTAYYGRDAYGIEAAAQVYLGKSAVALSLDEAALLAAIPLAPQFNPLDNEDAARDRQLDLLRLLRANGLVSQEDFNVAAAQFTPIRTDLVQPPRIAPTFAIYAREQVEDILQGAGLDGARLVSRGGLRITTTLDLDLYYQTECTLRAHLAQLNGVSKTTVTTLIGQPCVGAAYLRDVGTVSTTSLPDSGSLLVLDVATGEIQAMVGSATDNGFEPGPVFHPFVYLGGFLSGNFHPATMLLDIPQAFPGISEGLIYTPRNPDGVFRGPLNLRDAMASGLTAPVAFVANTEGLTSIINKSHQMGLNSLDDLTQYDLSLVERGGNVSLLDTTYAYSVFASMGFMQGVDTEAIARNYRSRNPVAILEIADASGTILWAYDQERINLSRTSILSGEMAYLVNNILGDNNARRGLLGIDPNLTDIGRPASVVNGMPSSSRESWSIGYTPQLVGGVLLYRGDDAALSLDTYGLQGATPIWQAIMRYSHDRYGYEAGTWARPSEIIEITVCEKSGLLPTADSPCPRRSEIFLDAIYPTQEDTYWRSVAVNSQTRQLASSSTPAFLVLEEVYFIPPASAMEWWVTNNQALPPTEYDTIRPEALRSVQLLIPQDFSYVGGVVDVRGTMETTNLESYQLRYGEGWLPANWLDIGTRQTNFTQGMSIGTWDTSALNGFYTLQLSVVYSDGTSDSSAIQVTIDNTPPTIDLQVGESGNDVLFRWPQQPSIPIRAEVADEYPINRVEFYVNGALVGTDTEAPYAYDYVIQGIGVENFSAAVFDQVGNVARDEVQVEIIRGN